MDSDRQSNVSVTLALYEQGVEAYLGASNPTPHPAYEELLHRVVSLLPAGSRMLEIGTGPGHDALFFEQHGLLVQRSDGTRADLWLDRGQPLACPRTSRAVALPDLHTAAAVADTRPGPAERETIFIVP